MQKILNRLVIVILSLSLVLFGAGALVVQAATPALVILSPTTGPPGTTVTVTANNTSFNGTSGETVIISYDGTALTPTTTANGTGGLNGTNIAIPASVFGAHIIAATGSSSGYTGNATFSVTSIVAVSPTNGAVGNQVSISGAGCANGETIAVTYDGSAAFSATAGSNGSWSSTYVIPASASGARTITATGATSGAQSTTFTVTPSMSINRTSGTAGTSVTITGTSFAASERVSATFDLNPLPLNPASPLVSSKGAWTATFIVPPSTAGTHTIHVFGSVTTAGLDLTFTTVAGITSNHPSAATGSTVVITGSGFGAGETGITINYDGTQVGAVASADTNGGWKANLVVPPSASGSHTIHASGSVTTTAADITLTVTPAISASRASAPPASSVTITGSGFGSGETSISITYDNAAVTPGITADAIGSWKASFNVPASPAGAHTVGATGPTSTAVPPLPFSVISSISINPPSAVPGKSLTITGAGFGASETGITVMYDGQPVTTVPASPTVNANGSWTATFTVPESAAGSHSITAKGAVTPETSLGNQAGGGGVNVEAGISLDPTTGSVGATVNVKGSGFAANSPLKFTFDNNVAGSATTDSSGSFDTSIVIPQSLHGDHTIKIADDQNHSKTATFTMESTLPPTPNPISPGDGSSVGLLGGITPALKWSPVTDPSGVSYTLQLDTDSDFTHPILEKTGISGSHYTLTSSEALPHGSYYWRVKAIDGASNESPWSPTWSLKSGATTLATLLIIIVLILAAAGAAVYFLFLRKRQGRGWEGVPVPEPEAPRPIPAQWRLVEPGEGAGEGGGERSLPYRLALPQPAKGEKTISTEDMARLRVIVDFAQSLPLVEPGYTAKWLLELAQTSLGTEESPEVYKQLLENQLQVRYEPAWMRHPIFQDLSALLEGQPILQDLNAFVDAVNRCAAESALLLREINSQAVAEIPGDLVEKGGWGFISAVYTDAMRWFLGKSLHDPSERDYVLKHDEAGTVSLWGEENTAFAEGLVRAADEQEALKFRALHLKLRRSYRNSDTVKQLVDMMTQMAVQRDRLSSAFSQFDNFTR